jgi:hypothetical protein
VRLTSNPLPWSTLLISVGQLLTAIGQKNGAAFYASVTAVLACLVPAVVTWFKPAPSPPLYADPFPVERQPSSPK